MVIDYENKGLPQNKTRTKRMVIPHLRKTVDVEIDVATNEEKKVKAFKRAKEQTIDTIQSKIDNK